MTKYCNPSQDFTQQIALHCVVFVSVEEEFLSLQSRLSYFCFSHRREKYEPLVSGYSLMYLQVL